MERGLPGIEVKARKRGTANRIKAARPHLKRGSGNEPYMGPNPLYSTNAGEIVDVEASESEWNLYKSFANSIAPLRMLGHLLEYLPQVAFRPAQPQPDGRDNSLVLRRTGGAEGN